jgi:peptidyl-prolyl cis-trans isomerase C
MAEARAKAMLARLDGDAQGFALAARESDCESKAQGGHLCQLGPGDTVPEFEAALRMLTEDAMTPAPILSRHGWHLIRLNAIALGQVLPYESVRPKIAQALEKAAWARASREFIETLAKDAQITGASLAPI